MAQKLFMLMIFGLQLLLLYYIYNMSCIEVYKIIQWVAIIMFEILLLMIMFCASCFVCRKFKAQHRLNKFKERL